MAQLMPTLRQVFYDTNGNRLNSGKVYTYQAGTSTPLATYTDQGGLTANANPIVLSTLGEADIWLGANSYKFVVKDSSDVTIRTVDNVAYVNSGSITKAMINADVAGLGLGKNADDSLEVKVDDSTIEISSDTLRVKDLGISTAKLATSAVTTEKIADANVTAEKLAAGAVTPSKLSSANSRLGGAVQASTASLINAHPTVTYTTGAYNISTITRASNVVTVTFTATHSVVTGQTIYISGSTGGATTFNGAFTVTGTPSGTQITYAQTGANESGTPSTGIGTHYYGTYGFVTCLSLVRASNVVTVTTATTHYLTTGQLVTISSSTGGATSFNGTFVVASAPTSTTFTFAQTGPNESATAMYGFATSMLASQITTNGRPVRICLAAVAALTSSLQLTRASSSTSYAVSATVYIRRKNGSSLPSAAGDSDVVWTIPIKYSQAGFTTALSTTSHSGGTTTANCSSAHGLSIYDIAVVAGTNIGGGTSPNGTFTVTAVTSATQFQYSKSSDASTGGTVTGYKPKYGPLDLKYPPSTVEAYDTPSAGTYTYFISCLTDNAETLTFNQLALNVHEV